MVALCAFDCRWGVTQDAPPHESTLRRKQVAQAGPQGQTLRVLHQPPVADLAIAKARFSLRKGCSTWSLTDAFAFSHGAAWLSGSSFRRFPGRIATSHDLQAQVLPPLAPSPVPASPHPTLSPFCSGCGRFPSPSPRRCGLSSRSAPGSPSWTDASAGPAPCSGSWWTTAPQ